MWALKLGGGVVMLLSMVMYGWIYTPAFWLPWMVLCSCFERDVYCNAYFDIEVLMVA
jgi:hypothetical protein